MFSPKSLATILFGALVTYGAVPAVAAEPKADSVVTVKAASPKKVDRAAEQEVVADLKARIAAQPPQHHLQFVEVTKPEVETTAAQ